MMSTEERGEIMALDEPTAEAVRYLAGLTDRRTARRVFERLGMPEGGLLRHGWEQLTGDAEVRLRRALGQGPASLRLWLLQADDPGVNALLFRMGLLPPGLARDVADGLSFAPGRAHRPGSVRVNLGSFHYRTREEYLGEGLGQDAIVELLYEAEGGGARARARRAAREVRTAHWPVVAEYHAQMPLPGYARWALAERIDCPPELRAAFGAHAKFTHRQRVAGIVDSLAEYVATTEPALDTATLLNLLASGGKVGQLRSVEARLREQIRAELGGHVEAWAVLAQLLPEFVGTLPSLITLASVIAGPAPEAEDFPAEDFPAEDFPAEDEELTEAAAPEPVGGVRRWLTVWRGGPAAR